jgi:hypothetical protein
MVNCRSLGALLIYYLILLLPEAVYLVAAKSRYFDFLQLLKQCNEEGFFFTTLGANCGYTLHVANPPSEYIFHLQLLRSIGIKIFYVNSLCQFFISRIKYMCPQNNIYLSFCTRTGSLLFPCFIIVEAVLDSKNESKLSLLETGTITSYSTKFVNYIANLVHVIVTKTYSEFSSRLCNGCQWNGWNYTEDCRFFLLHLQHLRRGDRGYGRRCLMNHIKRAGLPIVAIARQIFNWEIIAPVEAHLYYVGW